MSDQPVPQTAHRREQPFRQRDPERPAIQQPTSDQPASDRPAGQPEPGLAQIGLRPIEASDEPFLREVYGSTREQELRVVPWTDDQKRVFCDIQFTAQDTFYRQTFADVSYDVILVDGEPAGRLYVGRWPDEVRVVDIALQPAFRGRWVGGR